MKTEALKITPGKKFRFNIEIELSEAQLKVLCEMAGDNEHEWITSYHKMQSNVYPHPVTLDPSFDLGLGADINDLLSLGFYAYSFIRDTPTKLGFNDLSFHPFSNKLQIIKQIEWEYQDCEIDTEYEPITFAISKADELFELENSDEI